MAAAASVQIEALNLYQPDLRMGRDFAPHVHSGSLVRRDISAANGQGLGDNLVDPLPQQRQLLLIHGLGKFDVAGRPLDTGDESRVAKKLPGCGGDDVLACVMLHMVQPRFQADFADRLLHSVGFLSQNMEDFPILLINVQHRSAADGPSVAGLTAASRKENRPVQQGAKTLGARGQADDIGCDSPQQGSVVKNSFCHGGCVAPQNGQSALGLSFRLDKFP